MRWDSELGTVVLEATYCTVIVVFVLMFLLSFGFFLYQQVMVSIVTNEIAENVARNYKLRDREYDSEVTISDIDDIGRYRYLFNTKSFEKNHEEQATKYAIKRLSATSLAQTPQGDNGVTVKIKTVTNDLGRMHYEVTVKQEYKFLLGELLEIFIGQDGTQVIESTAYVESNDVSHYIKTVKNWKYATSLINKNSKIAKTLDSIISIIKTWLDIFGFC